MILQSESVLVGGSSSHYRADVTYSYSVNGTRHVSHQISLWSSDLSSYGGILEAFIANHPVKSVVNVYYDPEHAENAVLVPGANAKENWLLMGMGGIAMLAGVGGMVARLRREPLLYALLNDPKAHSRTITLKKADITKGINSVARNFLGAGFSVMFTAALLLPSVSAGPSSMPGAPYMQSWRWIAGAVGFLAAFFFYLRIVRQSRSATCPLCKNLLNEAVFSSARCDACGTSIKFEGEAPTLNEVGNRFADRLATSSGQSIGFPKSRLVDVTGFMAFPVAFVFLLGAFDKTFDIGLATIFSVMLAGLGIAYYFPNQSTSKLAGSESSLNHAEKDETPTETRPYLLDFSMILIPPTMLLSCLFYLAWDHRSLDGPGLITAVIGFPLIMGAASLIYLRRSARARQLSTARPPPFVPLTLYALWLVGTFISVVFLVKLLLKLGWIA